MQVVALCCCAVLTGSRLLVGDLLYNLTRAKTVPNFIEAASIWVIPRFYFGNFPSRLAVLKEPLSDPSVKPLFINPPLFLLLDPRKTILWGLVASRWHPNLLVLHILLHPFCLWPDAISILNILFMFLLLKSWPFSYLDELIVDVFRVLIHYVALFVLFLCFQSSLISCQHTKLRFK